MAYALGLVKPHVRAAADHWGPKYDIRTIYGFGGGSVPGSDHPKGLALDFMINNIPNGRSVGDALAADVIANAAAYNVKYVIWYRRIWQNGQWKSYSGPSPHTDHVHVSFNATAGTGNPSSGNGTVVPVGNPVIPDWIERLGDGALWRKIAWSIVGILMIALGIILLMVSGAQTVTTSTVGKAVKGVVKK